MNYYEKHIGDYLKNTAHLSLLEHGIYSRLLDVYYTRESAIPADQAARLVGARSDDERAALDAVLAEFFQLVDGAWVQDRCEEVIARYREKQGKASASANARWGKAKAVQPECEGNANAMRPQSEGNAPNSQSPVTNKRTTPLPPKGGDGFDRFWQAYPRKTGKDAALRAWDKRKPDADLAARILAAVQAQCAWPQWTKDGGQFIPHPATWLNQARWEDEPPQVGHGPPNFIARLQEHLAQKQQDVIDV